MRNVLGVGFGSKVPGNELFYGIIYGLEMILTTQDFKGAYVHIRNGEGEKRSAWKDVKRMEFIVLGRLSLVPDFYISILGD